MSQWACEFPPQENSNAPRGVTAQEEIPSSVSFFGRKAKYLTHLQGRLDIPKRDSPQFYLDLKESKSSD